MTADLDAIRARLAAATPGPWAQGDPMFGWSNAQCVVSISDAAMGRDVMSPSLAPALADLDLIAHAPADLAALCDEVESLRAAVERVRAVALGEDDEAWVRRVGMSCLVSSASVLEALDGAE